MKRGYPDLGGGHSIQKLHRDELYCGTVRLGLAKPSNGWLRNRPNLSRESVLSFRKSVTYGPSRYFSRLPECLQASARVLSLPIGIYSLRSGRPEAVSGGHCG